MCLQFQPTPEESEVILELEKAINTLLGDDSFDVIDIYDFEEYADVPTLPTVNTIVRPVFDRNRPTIGPVLAPPHLSKRLSRPAYGNFEKRNNTKRVRMGLKAINNST